MGLAATETVVGVDVGSTEVKALVVDRAGARLSCARTPTQWRRDADGGVELPAETILSRVLSAMAEAVCLAEKSNGRLRVVSVAVTGMAEAGVLLDGAGTPMYPVIAWFDQRGGAELRELPEGLRDGFSAHTGLPLSALCSFAKLNWLLRYELPARDVGMWLNVPEYVAYALGGEAVTEPSLASRTGLLDQGAERPWLPALEYLGMADSALPPLTSAGTPVGRVRHAGVPDPIRGAVVTVAGHDHPVASVASGVWHDEHLFDSCGTSEALLRVAGAQLDDDQRARLTRQGIAQGRHVLPKRSILLGGTRGGFVLDHVLAMLGWRQRRGEFDAQWLTEMPAAEAVTVEGAHASSDDITIVVNSAEPSPLQVWSAALSHAMTEADTVIAAMSAEAGPHQHVTVAGGWSQMASFRTVKNASLPEGKYSQLDQPSAYGAAIFAEYSARCAATSSRASIVDIAIDFTTNIPATTGV